MNEFAEISLILGITLSVSIFMRLLKQPLVIGYIVSGILVGPYFLNILKSTQVIELFSKLGITALLFIVGLGLSPKVLKELGAVSIITGVGQIVFTCIFGYLISFFFGFSLVESLYISLALTFSSTIIILKLLSDKGDTNKLYGRISIGFLLVQDLVATITLVIISSWANVASADFTQISINLFLLLLKGFILLVVLFFITTKVLSKITSFVSRSQEFLFIASLSWGLGIAALYQSFGLSIEIGALVAGITLSMTSYSFEISSRLKPLRDFFITLFFILLGYHMVLDNWQNLIVPAISYTILIIIGNPLIVFILLNLLGFSRKTNFMAGLAVAQIGEFSLILATLGRNMGHISTETMSLITMVSIITIASSTYLIIFSEPIFRFLSKYLALLELRKEARKISRKEKDFEAIIFGYKRAGPEFARIFSKNKMKFLVVDLNPDIIKRLEKENIPAEYGDASDLEFLNEIPTKNLKIVISTIPEFDVNMLITRFVRRSNPQTIIMVMSEFKDQAIKLYEEGASHVVLSHYIGAKQASLLISKLGFEHDSYNKVRERHVTQLREV